MPSADSEARRRVQFANGGVEHGVGLDEPPWHSIGDVDPDLARTVRERLFRELEDETTLGAGSHFISPNSSSDEPSPPRAGTSSPNRTVQHGRPTRR